MMCKEDEGKRPSYAHFWPSGELPTQGEIDELDAKMRGANMKIDGKDEGCFLRTMNCGCYGCFCIVVVIVVLMVISNIAVNCLPD